MPDRTSNYEGMSTVQRLNLDACPEPAEFKDWRRGYRPTWLVT